MRAEQQREFAAARHAHGADAVGSHAGLFGQPFERRAEVLERNAVERGRQALGREVGQRQRGEAMRGEQRGHLLRPRQAAVRSAEHEHGRMRARARGFEQLADQAAFPELPLPHAVADIHAADRDRDRAAVALAHRAERGGQRIVVQDRDAADALGRHQRARPEQAHRVGALVAARDRRLPRGIDRAAGVGHEVGLRLHHLMAEAVAQLQHDALAGCETAQADLQRLVDEALRWQGIEFHARILPAPPSAHLQKNSSSRQ